MHSLRKLGYIVVVECYREERAFLIVAVDWLDVL